MNKSVKIPTTTVPKDSLNFLFYGRIEYFDWRHIMIISAVVPASD